LGTLRYPVIFRACAEPDPRPKTGGTRTGSLQVSARVPRPSRGYKSGAPRRKVTIRIFEDLERSKALRIAPRSPEEIKGESENLTFLKVTLTWTLSPVEGRTPSPAPSVDCVEI
jgi:hypothetical protein